MNVMTLAGMAFVWMACAVAAQAGTVTWTDADGDHNLYNGNNWSPVGSPDRDDWVFDDSAPGGSTQATFGTGTPEYPHCGTLTLSKTGGFTLVTDSVYRNINVDGGAVTVAKSGETYTIEAGISAGSVTYTVPSTSLLVLRLQTYGGTQQLTGGGRVRHIQGNNPLLNLVLSGDSVWEGNSDYNYQVASLAGTGGTFVKLPGAELAFESGLTDLSAFNGWVFVQAYKLRAKSGHLTGAKINFWPNTTMFNTPWEEPAVGAVQPPVYYFTDCTLAGAGYMGFVTGNWGEYGDARTGRFAHCTFTPGTNVTANSAAIFTVRGTLAFARVDDSPSVLHVDVLSAGGVAGTDYDRLAVIQCNNGGDVVSESDAANRLADCELVVDTTSVPPNSSFTGVVMPVLTSTSSFSSGCAFSKVTWIGPYAGTVSYENQRVTLTDIKVATQSGTVILLK